MKKVTNAISVLALFACSHDAKPLSQDSVGRAQLAEEQSSEAQPSALEPAAELKGPLALDLQEVEWEALRYAYSLNPRLDQRSDQRAEAVVTRLTIPGLAADSQYQIFEAFTVLPGQDKQSIGHLVYAGKEALTLHNGLYCFRLLSFAGHGDQLFYTHSSGSGIHRSRVGRIAIVGDEVETIESGAFTSVDLFVSTAGDRVRVETGRIKSLSNWENPEFFGWVDPRGDSLAIVDENGHELETW